MTILLDPGETSDAITYTTCPGCLADVAVIERTCAACGATVTFDVCLERTCDDPRERYRLARAMCILVGRPFAEVHEVLGTERPTVCADVSYAEAEAVVARLAEMDVTTDVVATGANVPAAPLPTLDAVKPAPVSVLRRYRLFIGALVSLAVIALLVIGGLVVRDVLEAPEARIVRTSLPTASPTLREMIRASLPSIVRIQASSSLGSGFCVATNRVLTNAHVVGTQSSGLVIHFHDGREIRARVVRRDEAHDLALLELVSSGCPPLALGDAGAVQQGDSVVVVGHPYGLEFSVSRGIVGHVSRQAFGASMLQVDAAVNPGNSGGPVFDEAGNVIGVVTLKLRAAEGVGFVMPINYAYEGTTPMATRPPGLDDTVFEARAAAAREEGLASTRALTRNLHKPAIAFMQVTTASAYVTLVYIEAPTSESSPPTFVVSLVSGERCVVTADVLQRTEIDAAQTSSALPPNLRSVLASARWRGKSLVEIVEIPFARCGPGAEPNGLTVADGFPGADHKVIVRD